MMGLFLSNSIPLASACSLLHTNTDILWLILTLVLTAASAIVNFTGNLNLLLQQCDVVSQLLLLRYTARGWCHCHKAGRVQAFRSLGGHMKMTQKRPRETLTFWRERQRCSKKSFFLLRTTNLASSFIKFEIKAKIWRYLTFTTRIFLILMGRYSFYFLNVLDSLTIKLKLKKIKLQEIKS